MFSYSSNTHPEVELLDHMVVLHVVLFLLIKKNLHIVFYTGYTNLHSHQLCSSVPFSPNPLQHLLSSVFLMMAIPHYLIFKDHN